MSPQHVNHRYPQPINHSMIFKTFDSKIDKWTSKIGILGKSFNELGTAINNAFKSAIDNLDNFDENDGFWESFKNNLFSNNKTDRDWIKNSIGEIISKENIDSYIKELDLDSAKKKLQEIFDWQEDINNGETTWNKYFDTCKNGKEYIIDLIKNTDDLSKLTGEDLVKVNQQARSSALAHNEAIKAQTFSAKAGKVALQALATAGNMLLMWGVSKVISGLYELSQVSETVANNAKDLGDSFKSTSSNIEDYKSKIEELYSTINDSGSSIEEVTNARKSLMSVQDELIDKFGTEKGVINGVTEAISGQTDALDRLTNAKWQEIKNEFNDGGFWNNVANWSQGYEDNIDRMIDEMEDAREILSFSHNDFIGKNGDYSEIKRQIEQLGWIYKDTLGGYVKEGNLENIYSDILKIQDLVNNFDAPDMLIKDLSKDANEIKQTLDDYEGMWDTYVLQDRIFADKDLADSFKNINDAYAEYQKAFASGDEESIAKAQDNFANILTQATEGVDDQSVVDYFTNMYPALQSVVSGWQFNVAFDANTDDLQGKVQTVLDELKDENGRSLTVEEILGLGEENKQYQELVSIAHDYNMEIDEMIELLKERNLVSAMDYQGLVGLFGQEDIDKLSPENLEIAYTIKNVGNMTFEELQAEIQRTKEIVEEPVSLTISQTIDQLNTQLKPAFDSLKSAWQDIFTDDGFALNSIDILSTCDSIKSKLDDMSELGLNVDYIAFEDFVRVLNNTESIEQDIETAFDSLATSITQAALSGTEDFETMKAALEDLGVANSEMIAFKALISNTEALKEAGLDLQDTTYDDIEAFTAGIVPTENYEKAVRLLKIQKILCAENPLDTSGDIMNLYLLATAAGIATDTILQLMRLNATYEKASSEGNTAAALVAKGQMEVVKQNVLNQLAHLGDTVDFGNIGGGKSAAGNAGKDAGKSYKDALKEELSNLDNIISGITKSIDNQISTVNEQKSTALDALDAEKDALEDAKDAAVEALEAERDARLEVIEAQKKQLEEEVKLIDKQINQKQDEINAINDAADARQRELDLQKAQYELERMQNQNTILQYSEAEGMHYVQDTSGIRDAKEQVDEANRQIEIAAIEKEIDLLENEKDLINEQIDLLDEQTNLINNFYDAEIEKVEKFYDDQIKAIEKQRTETESYFESIIQNLENSKSKYEELTSIVDKAELSAKLKQLGIDEEALLNGSEEEFQKLKDTYMGIVSQLNEGNDKVISSLQSLSGYGGTAPSLLSDSKDELDAMNDKLDASNQSIWNMNDSLTDTTSQTTTIASNVGTIADGLNQIPDSQSITDLSGAFDALAESIDKVAKALGLSEESEIGTLAQAISDLNNITLDSETNGIIAQFANLKTAIDSVTSAINGGGGESSDSEGQGGSAGKGGGTRGKDSKGDGGGGGSLTDAITSMGETAAEIIGEPDAEGDGTVIGEFGSLKTSVNNVTSAIGSGESEDSKGKGGGESRGTDGNGEDSGNLIGSIVNLGETTEETLGEPGGDGVIGRFEQFKEPIAEAAGHVHSISDGLDEIDGKEVECTITVNVKQNGSTYADGTVLGSMNLNNAAYTAQYGKACAKGTGKYKGLPKAEKNALVSEYGQTEMTVLPNGNTIITNGPTLMDLPKGTVIFNENQTKQLMRNKVHMDGKAHADGTKDNIQPVTTEDVKIIPFRPNDIMYDYMQKWNAYFGNINNQIEKLVPNSMYERSQQMHNVANQITNGNIANKNQPNVHVGDIHITCPGVTSKEVAKQVGVELNHMFNGLHLDADQQSRIR